MISESKGKFSGDNGIDIGSHEIDARLPNGNIIKVILKIGTPYLLEGNYCIRIELENLDRSDGPLMSYSSLGAVIVGLQFMARRLKIYKERHGYRFFWSGSDREFDLI